MAREKVETAYLCIVRNKFGQSDIEGKISLGRKTAYFLMGTGLHGGSGLNATLNGQICPTFSLRS